MQNKTRDIITSVIEANGLASYTDQAEPVIRDLENLMDNVLDRLVAEGINLGATQPQVEGLLIQVGLAKADPEPEPEPETTVSEDSLLQRLAAFARQHGFRG